MEPFDQRGALNEALGKYPSQDIPAELNWKAMGPKIQTALKKEKKKRRFFWWLPLGLLLAGGGLYLGVALDEVDLGYFPIPAKMNAPLARSTFAQSPNPVSDDAVSLKDAVDTEAVRVAPAPAGITGSSPVGAAKNTQGQVGGADAAVAAGNRRSRNQDVRSDGSNAPDQGGPDEQHREESLLALTPPLQESVVLNVAPFLPVRAHYPPAMSGYRDPVMVAKRLAFEQDASQAETSRTRNRWRIAVRGGANLHRSVVSSVSEEVPNRKPEALAGVSTSLLLERALGDGPYAIGSGFSWMTLTQRESYREELAIQIFQPNTPDTIYRNAFTGAETILYTDSVAGIRALEIRQHHRLRTLTLPLMVGRQWGTGDWPVALWAGLDLNWSWWKTGQTVGSDYQLVNTNTQRTFTTALRLEGQWYGPRTSVGRPFAALSYQRFLQKIPGTLAGTQFQPETISLMLGLRF